MFGAVLELKAHWIFLYCWIYHFSKRVPGHTGTLCCTPAGGISAIPILPIRWCSSVLELISPSVFELNLSEQMDGERWPNTLASTFTGHYPPSLFFCGCMWMRSELDTGSRCSDTEGKDNQSSHICKTGDASNTRGVKVNIILDVLRVTKGAHVEVDWISCVS